VRVRWGIVYYRAPDGSVPAEDFLSSCPTKIEARILAVLDVVRAAPPPAFSGGGMWEAMHGSMSGYYEIRVTGPRRVQYRLFCLLDNAETDTELARRGFSGPQIAVINGMSKPIGQVFSDREYRKHVRDLGGEYRRQFPRRIAQT
jgi:Txe/YoeB family toxin of Txe-Axe toxin-antitoxin module